MRGSIGESLKSSHRRTQKREMTMGKIHEAATNAFIVGKEMKQGNVRIETRNIKQQFIVSYLLHGNLIAERVHDAVKLTNSIYIQDGGHQTPTTKRHLNELLRAYNAGHIYQYRHVWYYVDTYGNEYSFNDSPSASHYGGITGFYIGEYR